MIISRTPLRLTLGGGGTDLPSYYTKYGGFIFSASIDKYVFVKVKRSTTDSRIRFNYSRTEAVECLDNLQHGLTREILRTLGIRKGIEITSTADIPAGTGLGSSSCFAIGLLHALHALKGERISLKKLAEEDFRIESAVLKRPIGKQDPYLAVFGGLAVMDIAKNGSVNLRKARVTPKTVKALNRNLLVFFTGVTRNADEILAEQTRAIRNKKKGVAESMHRIKQLGYEILRAVEEGKPAEVGPLFHAHWQHKKKTSSKISNERFDRIYEKALAQGALGGKISGAGGGGFFTFYVEKDHEKFRKAMRVLGLKEMRYRFDFEGSKVLIDR